MCKLEKFAQVEVQQDENHYKKHQDGDNYSDWSTVQRHLGVNDDLFGVA
jgi:acid stress-induced BolA-like protein IbaG/YrbA